MPSGGHIETPHSDARLAPVYVNGRKVPIEKPSPTVADIVRRAGHDPAKHDAYLLQEANDARGTPVGMDKVLQLAGRREPLYLRCVPKGGSEKHAPGVAPTLTTQPQDDPRREMRVTDLHVPAPPGPEPAPEPPGPPGLA